MGLDQYAYAVPKKESESRKELAYWRKHNRLQGWMEQLWYDKGRPNAQTDGNAMGDFNCVDLERDANDIDALEEAIENFALPETQGFFFGEDSYLWKSEEVLLQQIIFTKRKICDSLKKQKRVLTKVTKLFIIVGIDYERTTRHY